MIRKVNGGYKVWSVSKKRYLSHKPMSLKSARDQHYAIQNSKQRRGEITADAIVYAAKPGSPHKGRGSKARQLGLPRRKAG